MQQSNRIDSGLTVAGVDEAGRGPLAGPVVTAAVILDPQRAIPGLRDSKRLSASRREQFAQLIKRDALAWSIAAASCAEIDELNILAATMLAMRRAIAALSVLPGRALIDGNRLPDLEFDGVTLAAEAIVGGDAKHACVSAASILAKTARDAFMTELDVRYPAYGFARHKGYGTRAHLDALRTIGPCEQHRRSFAPVRAVA